MGLGRMGSVLSRTLKLMRGGIEISAVTDTYIKESDFLRRYGLPYVDTSRIMEYFFDYIVITPEKYFHEIKGRLIQQGITDRKIKSIGQMGEILDIHYCSLCHSYPFAWEYIGMDYSAIVHKSIAGAFKRRGGCPICWSSDRERYVYFVIKEYTSLLDGRNHRVLHFAPEPMLSKAIRGKCGDSYVTADIMPGRADVAMDITDMQFHDKEFEYIICNHVMEHVEQEGKAFSELKRCMAENATLVLTVPICWGGETFEDKNIVTEEDRIKHYGQGDHVRLYGNDIVARVERFGFDVQILKCSGIVDEKDIRRFGFIKEDSVLLCRKKQGGM